MDRDFERHLKEILTSTSSYTDRIGQYILDSGGKRLRPKIVVYVGQAAGLSPDVYMPFAYTVELMHTASLLHDAIARQQNLLVWGDFDVDGQTSTALLVTALRTLAGDARVHFHVPNRFEESHGIRVPKLKEKLAEFPADLLVTCDTGIAEAAGVGYARDCGLTVVITDHHDLSAEFHGLTPGVDPLWGRSPVEVGVESVLRADAIVNPKFLPDSDPLRTLRRGLTLPLDLWRHVDEEIDQRVQMLISKGDLAKEEGQKLREKLLSPMFTAPDVHIGTDIEQLLSKHGVPTRAELERLHAQIDALSNQLESLTRPSNGESQPQ